GRGEEKWFAGDEFFGLLDVGNNSFGGLTSATGDASQCKRRAHNFQEMSAVEVRKPFGGVSREFAVKSFGELSGARQLIQAAPIGRRRIWSHRWHTLQSVSCVT